MSEHDDSPRRLIPPTAVPNSASSSESVKMVTGQRAEVRDGVGQTSRFDQADDRVRVMHER